MNDQQTNILLVSEVEKRPILYNYKLPGYSKKNETKRAWGEVGRRVNLTANECKGRWKNLRAVFVRNMKRFKRGSGAKSKKAYYLLEAMQFTVPFVKALHAPSGSRLIQPKQEVESEQFSDNNSVTTNDSLEILPSPQQRKPPTQRSTPRTEMFQEKRNLSESSPPQPKRTRPSINDAVDIAFIDYLEAKKNVVISGHPNQDPNSKTEALKMFLLSMLPDLLKMTDEELRLFKRKALDAVDEIFSNRTMASNQVASLSRSPPRSPKYAPQSPPHVTPQSPPYF